MSMIIYFPLEHVEQRYTTHLDRDILKYLDDNKIPYKYLQPNTLSNEIKNGSFLDADNTVYRQFNQMQQLIGGLINGTIPKDATLFITDIWNFGIMSIPYLNFFGNYNLKVKGVLHAGSFTDTDFVRKMERYYKNFEDTIFDICDTIFVGSEFIKQDIIGKRIVDASKLVVTGLPLDDLGMQRYPKYNDENNVIFNGRNCDEKQPYLFELLKTKLPQYNYLNTQEINLSKSDYYALLSRSKVVVSFALQENFGYGIQEAVRLGCVPVLPNRLVYPEQFEEKYLYNSFDECVDLVDYYMQKDKQTLEPKISANEEIFNKWFN